MGFPDIQNLSGLSPVGGLVNLAMPPTWAACLGLLPGIQCIFKFGYSPDTDPGVGAPSDLWPGTQVGGGTEVGYRFLPSTAVPLSVFSSSPSASNGNPAGAWTVRIQGLDDEFNEIEEVVSLAGVSLVPTTLSFRRVYRAFVIEGGLIAGDRYRSNQGDITIQGDIDDGAGGTETVPAAYILSRFGQTTQTNYTIPAGKTGLIVQAAAQTLGTDDAEIGFTGSQLDPETGSRQPFRTGWYATASRNVTQIDGGQACTDLPEKTDVRMICFPENQNVQVSGWYTLLLMANRPESE